MQTSFPSSRMLRLMLASMVIVLAIGAGPSSIIASSEPPASGFDYMRVGQPALVNPRQWVLQGTKQPNGSCRYTYPNQEREIPENGWVFRSIGINMSNCTKLMEEGSPATQLSPPADPAGGRALSQSLPTTLGSASAAQTMAVTSTRGAWQMVSWLDFISLPTTRDRTQIHWTYNGSSVLSGNAEGWWWHDNLGWTLIFNELTQRFEADGAFRGQTRATFRNTFVCSNPPTYTYYLFNRVYGHKNGTATISQSSQTYDDCLPLHVDVTTGYN